MVLHFFFLQKRNSPTVLFSQLRIKSISQGICQQVKRQHNQNDHDGRKNQLPWIGLHPAPCGIGQGAERRHRQRHAQSEEGQVGFRKDRRRNLLGGGNDDDAETVRQDVLSDDSAGRSADRLCRQNIFILLDLQNLSPHEPCHANPVQKGKDDEHRHHVGAQSADQRDFGKVPCFPKDNR